MSTQPIAGLTPEEYLQRERQADYKSEYYNGEVFAMSGGARRHSLIASNLAGELRQRLKAQPGEVHGSDLRLRVSATGLFTYPDVIVVCGEAQFADNQRDTLLNPTLIIEVLSESTKNYDQGEKFWHYRSLSSLQEYLLFSQDGVHVEHYQRQEARWVLEETDNQETVLTLPSIHCQLPLAEAYDKVQFPSVG